MNVQELEGAELDAAVAKALGYVHHGAVGLFERNDSRPWCLSEVNDWWKSPEGHWICGPCTGFPHNYSAEWERGGPIIEREGLAVLPMIVTEDRVVSWVAHYRNIGCTHLREGSGPTPLIAAMRAYVAAAIRRGSV